MNDSLQKTIIITIDGPAGSGKSSVAKTLAKNLQFEFLDTGAMYRAVAWCCQHRNIEPEKATEVSEMTRQLDMQFREGELFVDGIDVTPKIRTPEISRISSVVAQHDLVRQSLVERQRLCAANTSMVTEGRDQGTIVFPQATCKFFLTARPEVRAQRRYEEMIADGQHPDFEQLVSEIRERDERDANRRLAPLVAAEDAETVDTSDRTFDEVVAYLENRIRSKLKD